MNRNDLKELTNIRIKEAKILLSNGRYSGAYYLSGYAIECALKACIAKKTHKYDFPPNPKTTNQIYTHDLSGLMGAAGLKTIFESDLKADSNLERNWTIVKDWSESCRYIKYGRFEAENLYSAITSKKHGVLRWIKQYW